MRTSQLGSLCKKASLFFLSAPLIFGQAPASSGAKSASQPASPAADMAQAWDQVIGTAVAQSAPDPALAPPPNVVPKSDIDDFLSHFYFDSRTDFQRYQNLFTGSPTTSGVINAPDTGYFNPAGIPSPSAFQPGANRIEEFLDFGTTGYGSDRVNTHFALRYRQDLSHVDLGSPSQNVIETFPANRLYEWLDASVTVNGKSTDGAFAGTSFTFGRMNVYGAEYASFDGGSFSVSRRKFDVTFYGGRRFSYFSDPKQRAIGGANLNLKLNPNTSIEIQSLWYIRGTNRIAFRRRMHERWLVTSSFRAFGGSPVDFDAAFLYSSRSGRATVRGGFFQKLTDNDYTYDYTSLARDLASQNPLYRLYLGPLNKYSQFNVDGHLQVLSNLRAGATIVVRKLNDENTQTPFETSFRDYRFNGQYFPWRKIETFFEYHAHSSDRMSPVGQTTLDGLVGTGETAVKDLTGEIRRTFGEGRFSLSGGVYYRRMSMQDAFYYLTNIHQSGVLGSAWVRLDRRTRIYFDYSLDNDFLVFVPDLKNSQVFRIGLNWKY
ncbi:MAG TPA: hypothetical protein VKB79_19580 [Bryobacteraceae bacterium]|nr:hypothetical protein [Bryobacteraceae bacterium]